MSFGSLQEQSKYLLVDSQFSGQPMALLLLVALRLAEAQGPFQPPELSKYSSSSFFMVVSKSIEKGSISPVVTWSLLRPGERDPGSHALPLSKVGAHTNPMS